MGGAGGSRPPPCIPKIKLSGQITTTSSETVMKRKLFNLCERPIEKVEMKVKLVGRGEIKND